jgi:SAM-dependent methyltransferase
MGVIRKLTSVLAHPTAYRLWQSPFVKAKFKPIFAHNDMSHVKRVLDVGCGPGTNAELFLEKEYLGLDLNPAYIEQAKKRFGDRFQVADVCTYQADQNKKYDFVLMNSLLHHIDTANVNRILTQLTKQLTPDGHIHILDLVLPEKKCLARAIARADRGDFPRPLEQWKQLFSKHFKLELFEPYPLQFAGVTLWNMVYFKGALKTSAVKTDETTQNQTTSVTSISMDCRNIQQEQCGLPS